MVATLVGNPVWMSGEGIRTPGSKSLVLKVPQIFIDVSFGLKRVVDDILPNV
jgi:hypothetical protein